VIPVSTQDLTTTSPPSKKDNESYAPPSTNKGSGSSSSRHPVALKRNTTVTTKLHTCVSRIGFDDPPSPQFASSNRLGEEPHF